MLTRKNNLSLKNLINGNPGYHYLPPLLKMCASCLIWTGSSYSQGIVLYFGCETEELSITWYLFLQTLQKYLKNVTKSPLRLYCAKPNRFKSDFNISYEFLSNLSSSCLHCMHYNWTETARRASSSFIRKDDVTSQVLVVYRHLISLP